MAAAAAVLPAPSNSVGLSRHSRQSSLRSPVLDLPLVQFCPAAPPAPPSPPVEPLAPRPSTHVDAQALAGVPLSERLPATRPASPLPTPPASPQIPPPGVDAPPSHPGFPVSSDELDKSMRRIDSGVEVARDEKEDIVTDALSESESSTLISGKLTDEFAWTVATAQGYRLLPSTSIFSSSPYYAKPLHEHFEDFHWPTLTKPIHTPVPGTEAAAASSDAARNRSPSPKADGQGVLSNLVGLLRTGKSKSNLSSTQPARPALPEVASADQMSTASSESDVDRADTTSLSSSTSASNSIPPRRSTSSHTATHPLTATPYTIFVLADGHGGHGAAASLVPRMRDSVTRLVESRTWDLSPQADDGDLSTAGSGRAAFCRSMEDIYERLDDDYCARKVAEFTAYKAALAAHQQAVQQARDAPYTGRSQTARAGAAATAAGTQNVPPPPKKPSDDGCTMVVNVIIGTWMVNANLGDSRTVLARRRYRQSTPAADLPAFSVRFASTDHSPTHPPSVHHVIENGGIFISENGTPRRFTPPPLSTGVRERERERYAVLAGARVYRTLNDEMREGGVSNLKTLNLLGSLGDVGFKVGGKGKVIRSRPDVSFVPLKAGLEDPMDGVCDSDSAYEISRSASGSDEERGRARERSRGSSASRRVRLERRTEDADVDPEGDGPIVDEFLYISCTDGVWDHLRCQASDEAQCDGVVAFATARMMGVEEGEYSDMERVAMALADREKTRELYVPGVPRVDDVTVVVGMGKFVE
ncbi:hypothetical protein M427DRAFT_66352 [Gonapodya prolifera JEL478]|uniref:PPM-type phosphatase domain-containing protein n=1 Tax=Gonapodya prolifera (strain JEL478) TaxID=1344416 RepID=A0A139AWA4_GONPJ|nr:hypothetical protein M427DRAFT_66352 [Gonapodya prolifera JEL478]|eukprot:KXS21016.1 hypothetical protein M427DRAFT_66352 [Gonapodya prolifera JEL478]